MTGPIILVTGATGFIGGWVTEILCAAGFRDIRAGVRLAGRASRISRLPVNLVHCDMMNWEALDSAVRGVGVVINCVRDYADSGVTVEGTKRLLASAAANGASRIIQISSVAVYGNASGNVTEDTAPVPPTSRYAVEKRAAEELCRAAAGPDLTVAVVRPSLVYGPHGEEWSARFIRGIVSGQLQQLGAAGEGEANLIYAGDLGRFAAHLAVRELPHYSIYNANGSEIPTFNEYFSGLSRALGQGPLPDSNASRVKTGLRRQVRRVGRLILRKQGARIEKLVRADGNLGSILNRVEEALRYDVRDGPSDQFARRVIFSIDRARQIGFSPQTTVEDGIKTSISWARSQGLTA